MRLGHEEGYRTRMLRRAEQKDGREARDGHMGRESKRPGSEPGTWGASVWEPGSEGERSGH